MLASRSRTRPSSRNGWASASPIRRATAAAVAASSTTGSRMANSSPPSRRDQCRRTGPSRCSRSATSTSSRSPIWWPRVSLTSLNRSRSSSSSASVSPRRVASSIAGTAVASSRLRLASPVRSSWSERCSCAARPAALWYTATSGSTSSGTNAALRSITSTTQRGEREQRTGAQRLEEQGRADRRPQPAVLVQRDRHPDEHLVDDEVRAGRAQDDRAGARRCRSQRRPSDAETQGGPGGEHGSRAAEREHVLGAVEAGPPPRLLPHHVGQDGGHHLQHDGHRQPDEDQHREHRRRRR